MIPDPNGARERIQTYLAKHAEVWPDGDTRFGDFGELGCGYEDAPLYLRDLAELAAEPAAPIVDDLGVTYRPWSDPNTGVIGFEATSPGGLTDRIYLNPSGGSDDGVPSVFLYAGTGDPAQDGAIAHVVPFKALPDDELHRELVFAEGAADPSPAAVAWLTALTDEKASRTVEANQ